MRPIDIHLAQGDTLPTARIRLTPPDNEDDTPGAPIPLDQASSIVLRYQVRSGQSAAVEIPAVPVAPAATSMQVDVDWRSRGAIPPGEYFARVIVRFVDGSQISFPDGDDFGNDDDSFLRIHVARDFLPAP